MRAVRFLAVIVLSTMIVAAPAVSCMAGIVSVIRQSASAIMNATVITFVWMNPPIALSKLGGSRE